MAPVPVHHLSQTLHHTQYPAIDPTKPSNSAAGKTVVISGGASGIGYAIAQAFSAAGAATVIILARRQEALDEASAKLRAENEAAKRGTDVWTYLLDINDGAAAESVFEAIRQRISAGGAATDADILVTSAAYLMQGQSALECSTQIYRDSLETNVIGNLNVVRAFLAPDLPAIPFSSLTGVVKDTSGAKAPTQQKVILDVSSSASYYVLPGQAAYSASKMAFTRIMQSLQTELEQLEGQPIRVHSFNPGVIYTPAAASLFKVKSDIFPIPWDDETLAGGFAVWLASPAAAFLKGRFVMSTWDVEEMMAQKNKFEEDPEFGVITLKI
ncbi:putative short-chain dehydrogenase reductase sdr protein [Neofusicoccum parvum UCRNP2]|uniref:Short chain dehydrogenase n=3 Tax=Neofusicoccum TaxID=407951 RepID=A0ABR3SEK7_9PEZI|nr:putative short-chain dehydrogenase reductase sdr protein [Neofusicoccum parvum UCRNP2]GME52143.1 putative short-chain dehydrogenase reductase sdr protein [Neofusicoccum parvum]